MRMDIETLIEEHRKEFATYLRNNEDTTKKRSSELNRPGDLFFCFDQVNIIVFARILCYNELSTNR